MNNINPVIGSVVRVINEYFKSLDDEIDLKLNDNIQIILDDEEYNDGWYYGKNLRTNLIGLFPKCFTVPIKEAGNAEGGGEDKNYLEEESKGAVVENKETGLKNHISTNDLASAVDNDQFTNSFASSGGYSFKNNNGSNISLSRSKNISGSRRVLSPLALNSSQTSLSTAKRDEFYSANSGSFSRNYNRVSSTTSLNSPLSPQDAGDEILIQELINQSNVADIHEEKNIESWEPKDVAVYFYYKKIETDGCLKFYDHKINGKILLALDIQDLKNELDILSFGTRYNINKEIEHLKQLVSEGKSLDNEYDSSSFSPSVRSSRRSSLLLPAATVKNRSSFQSINDSVILDSNNMAGLNASNNGRKTSTGKPHDQTGQLTRNGTQSYRSISNNPNMLQLTSAQSFGNNPVLRRAESSSNNIHKVGVNSQPTELEFESPRRAPQPPPGPSPVSNSLPKSPDVTNFYNSPLQSNKTNSDRIYNNPSNNNSASNMLKKSTSFLQRNLSFKGGPSNASSRNITPNPNASATSLQSPSLNKTSSNFNNNVIKTPQRSGLKESRLGDEFETTPKSRNNNLPQYPMSAPTMFGDSLNGDNNMSDFDTVNSPIYQPPKNSQSRKPENFGSFASQQPNSQQNKSRNASLSSSTNKISSYNHRRSESGGSFLDLFNRLDTIHVGSGKNTPTIGQTNSFLPPTSSYVGAHSHNSLSKSDFFDDKASSNYMSADNGRPTSSIYVHSRTNTNGTNYINAFGHSKKPSYIPNGVSSGSLTEKTSSSVLPSTEEYTSNDDSFTNGEYVDFDKTNASDSEITGSSTGKSSHSKVATPNKQNILATGRVKTGNPSTTASASKLKKFQTSAFKEGINSIPCSQSIKTASMHGWMGKKNTNGGIKGINTWKRRYFLLHNTRLSYYTSPDDTKERGLIDITGYSLVPCNLSSDNNTDKLITLFSSSMSSKNKYFFKIVPPKPGSKKGVNFTQQKVYYFALDSQEDTRAWMNSMLKATIDLDTSVPIISSCDTPTISLEQAKEMLEDARQELLEREKHKNQQLHLSNNTILIRSPRKQEAADQTIISVGEDEVVSGGREKSLDPSKK